MRGLPQHYLVLGLGRRADHAQVRAAYVRLVKEVLAHQGDRNPFNRRLDALQQAYRCLIDPARRADYDRMLDQLALEHSRDMGQVQRRLRRIEARKGRPKRRPARRRRALLIAVLGGAIMAASRLLLH